METYAKSRKAKEFDWFKFLKKEKFTERELDAAEQRAGQWTTCACGNMCSIIKRDDDGEPVDRKLSSLGVDFYERIEDMKYSLIEDGTVSNVSKLRAQKVLQKIEARSKKLIEKEFLSIEGTIKDLGYKMVKVK